MIVEIICEKQNISDGEITVVCGVLNAIRKDMYPETTFSCKTKHFGMLSAIYSKLEEYLIHWKWRHAKGHQDYHIGTLYKWDTLNVEFHRAPKKCGQHISR